MVDYGFMIIWGDEGLGVLCGRCEEVILRVEDGPEGGVEHEALARVMATHPPQCAADR